MDRLLGLKSKNNKNYNDAASRQVGKYSPAKDREVIYRNPEKSQRRSQSNICLGRAETADLKEANVNNK